jgi:hypothetical protein
MGRKDSVFHSGPIGMPVIDLPITVEGAVIPVCFHISSQKFGVLQSQNLPFPNAFFGKGLIDSGASCTVIDKTIVTALSLNPTGQTQMHTPSTGTTPVPCNQYDVSVWFLNQNPPGLTNQQAQIHPIHFILPVIDSDFSTQNFDALIGRDILSKCQFTYLGPTGRFTMVY